MDSYTKAYTLFFGGFLEQMDGGGKSISLKLVEHEY